MAGVSGLFGKVPATGDFVRAGLSASLVSIWDNWLQTELEIAKTHFGAQWTGCYMSAPLWRFSVPAGAVVEHALVGVLMPSVDSVGRRFPLTIAKECEGRDLSLMHFSNVSGFTALEEVAFALLDESITLDEALLTVRDANFITPHATRFDAVGYCDVIAPEYRIAAATIEKSRNTDTSIWSCCTTDKNCLTLVAGLPRGGAFQALMDIGSVYWRTEGMP